VPVPSNWPALVNEPQNDAELEAIRRSVIRSQPFASDAWVRVTARASGLEPTLRAREVPAEYGIIRPVPFPVSSYIAFIAFARNTSF
jgi:hypothetical protein